MHIYPSGEKRLLEPDDRKLSSHNKKLPEKHLSFFAWMKEVMGGLYARILLVSVYVS